MIARFAILRLRALYDVERAPEAEGLLGRIVVGGRAHLHEESLGSSDLPGGGVVVARNFVTFFNDAEDVPHELRRVRAQFVEEAASLGARRAMLDHADVVEAAWLGAREAWLAYWGAQTVKPRYHFLRDRRLSGGARLRERPDLPAAHVFEMPHPSRGEPALLAGERVVAHERDVLLRDELRERVTLRRGSLYCGVPWTGAARRVAEERAAREELHVGAWLAQRHLVAKEGVVGQPIAKRGRFAQAPILTPATLRRRWAGVAAALDAADLVGEPRWWLRPPRA